LLSYRITDEFKLPFRITPFIEEIDARKVDVILKLRMDVPEGVYGTNILVRLPVPKNALSASLELSQGAVAQAWEYSHQDKAIIWSIKKLLHTQAEQTARVKVNMPGTGSGSSASPSSSSSLKKEFGNITMQFEIPMYSCSNVNIRALRTTDNSPIPYRWVRYITSSASYTTRI